MAKFGPWGYCYTYGNGSACFDSAANRQLVPAGRVISGMTCGPLAGGNVRTGPISGLVAAASDVRRVVLKYSDGSTGTFPATEADGKWLVGYAVPAHLSVVHSMEYGASVRLSAAQAQRPGRASRTAVCLARPVTQTPLCDRVRAGEIVFGGWAVAPTSVSAGILARGLDYVVLDLQHGTATEHDLPALTTAVRQAGATPLGRVRHAHPADIGRALDLGCEGVIVPNVESAEQAAAVAGACRYPPDGYRSGGGVMASQPVPLCIVMVESRQAMAELPATLRLHGVDGIYVGPRDLSYSLGCPLDPADPVLRPALEKIWADCGAAGKPAGVHATDGATARLYRENGCRLVTVVADTLAISRTVVSELAAARA